MWPSSETLANSSPRASAQFSSPSTRSTSSLSLVNLDKAIAPARRPLLPETPMSKPALPPLLLAALRSVLTIRARAGATRISTRAVGILSNPRNSAGARMTPGLAADFLKR